MADRENLPVPKIPDFGLEMGSIQPDDPVHYAQMNAILSRLLTNDAFLEKLANKMIEKALVAHVLDSKNTNMVLGADQAPALTALIDEERERITQLNRNKAPTSHASTDVTYGIGNASDFGHIKLSDSYTSSGGAASDGVGASSKALCDLYNIIKYARGNPFDPGNYFSSLSSYAYIKNGCKSFYLDGLTKTNLIANNTYYLGTLSALYRPITVKIIQVYADSLKLILIGYVKISPTGNVDLELTEAVETGRYLFAGGCYE